MIYDDQPQMVEAARLDSWRPGTSAMTQLRAAFAAIDRETLIDAGRRALNEMPVDMLTAQTGLAAEAVLVAAGILPASRP